MKKLIALAILFPSLGWGANSSLTVSSGTFLAVDGFTPANTNFRQAITIADPNATAGVAPVDPITGLTVHLSTGTNNIGIVNVISTNTLPVSGTFFQATQPIQGTVNVISTQPVTVLVSTVQVVGTTVTVQNIQNALPTGSNNIGIVNIVSTNTLAVSGSFSATALSTGAINTAVPGVANYNGYVNASGLLQAQRVNVSSDAYVYVDNPSTVTFNGVAQPVTLSASTNALGTVNIISTNTLNVNLSTVQVVNTTVTIANVQGIVQTAITSTPTVTVILSTVGVVEVGPWNVSILSTPTFQTILSTVGAVEVGAWNVSLLSTPTVQVILSTVATVGMFSDNGISSGTNRVNVLPAVYQNGVSAMVGGSQGNNAALTVGDDHNLWVSNQPAILPYSYTASTNSFSIAVSTNDAMALCGNSSHIVEVYGIRASCTQTTAGIIQLGIVKRSSAYSGVWSTAPIVSESSNYAGSKSTATFFTSANLVVGTLIGYLDSYKLGCMAPGTASPNDIYISPSDWRMKPIILNSSSECVAINMNGATITGGAMSATFDFEEINVTGYNPQ